MKNIFHYSNFIALSFLFILSSVALSREEKDDAKYQILAHKASIKINPVSQGLECIDTLTLRILDRKAEELEFLLMPFFKVRSIRIDNDEQDFEQKREKVILDDVPEDSVANIVIEYSGRMNFRTEFSKIGDHQAVFREEEILPHGNKALQFVRIGMEVPPDWYAIGPGKLIKQDSTVDSKTYTWELDAIIPMIGWICAGKFDKAIQRDAVTEISTYLFHEDSAHSERLISMTDSVIRYYNSIFTPYRFPKLAIVEVENWVAGKAVLAISFPSVIFIKKLAFETEDEFNKYPAILAHEIAHQWWPSTVFIENRDAALLSEGLCENSARLYSEYSGQLTERDSLNSHPLLRSLIMRSINGQDLPLHQEADLRSTPTHYLKASFVHNMLRRMMGDAAFKSFLLEYARRFDKKTVTMSAFQKLAEEVTRKNLDWFFNQWVKSKGIPRMKVYNAKAAQKEGKWVTKGRVRLIGYEKFTTYVDVAVIAQPETVITRVWLGTDSAGTYHNDVPFETITTDKPSLARLDPNGDILKYRKLPVRLGDLRQPWDGVMVYGTANNKEYLLERARHDSSEMDNAGWGFTIKPDTAITLQDLQKDRVFLYGNAEENRAVADLQSKFTYFVRNDTAFIKGEAISDSTLTLIQMIENPYIANGLMCWIAPLTTKAEPELLPYDHSWTLVKGKEEIASGTWEVKEEDVVCEVK